MRRKKRGNVHECETWMLLKQHVRTQLRLHSVLLADRLQVVTEEVEADFVLIASRIRAEVLRVWAGTCEEEFMGT